MSSWSFVFYCMSVLAESFFNLWPKAFFISCWDQQGRNVLLFFRAEYCLLHVCCYDDVLPCKVLCQPMAGLTPVFRALRAACASVH